MSVKKANLNYLYPFSISNWPSMKAETDKQWTPASSKEFRKHISGTMLDFMGVTSDQTTDAKWHGYCYTRSLTESMSQLNNKEIHLAVGKKTCNSQAKVKFRDKLWLFLSADHKVGILQVSLAIDNPCKLEDVYIFNNVFHKLEESQVATLMTQTRKKNELNPTNEAEAMNSSSAEGRSLELEMSPIKEAETMNVVLQKLLPQLGNNLTPLGHRFIIAAHVALENEDFNSLDVKKGLIYLAKGQNGQYQLTTKDMGTINEMFSNVLVCAHYEGFAACNLLDGSEYQKQFSTQTFPQAYLPSFIVSLLTEKMMSAAFSGIPKNSMDTSSLKTMRNLKLLSSIPMSEHSHINRAYAICREALGIPDKNEGLTEYLMAAEQQREVRSDYSLNIMMAVLALSQTIFSMLGNDICGAWRIGIGAITLIFAFVLLFINKRNKK